MKKTFANQENPALAFISAQEPPADQTQTNTPPARKEATEAPAGAPEGYILIPERKTRRLQLLIGPTLYNQVKAKAEAAGQSTNEYINNVLTDAVKEA